MKTFLEYVAEDILRKHGQQLADTAVVFPNKRAALFMSEHLARAAERPIWSPAYITISDLFRSQSALQVADPIKLIADLHKSFLQQTGIDETLDHFYGWGQLLLADFDDVDKHLANAHQVFANLSNYHELDDVSYLSPEQIETLRNFFQHFSAEHNTELKRRFLQLWNHFEDIYDDYRQRLRSQGMAYEGMLYREVAEQEAILLERDRYIFVGFNMLQEVEQELFSKLMRQGKARFYWDFDRYYMGNGHEAGHFVEQYLGAFPNELDNHEADIYDHLSRHKQLTVVSAATENVQARYADTWLKAHPDRLKAGRKTAIVLCNESLLPMVMHSLPEEVSQVNITTGYPLMDTPSASLVMQMLNMRIFPGRTSYRRLMSHPYAALFGDDFRTIAPDATPQQTLEWIVSTLRRVAAEAGQESALATEALFRAYTLMNRLLTLMAEGDISVDIVTLQRLAQQLLCTTTIPFHGEPAVGLQLMGVLETRNLDFDHLLLLSCNEGFLPKGVGDASFIPHSIRKAFGLTTIDHKVAVYAYYFHRLLQRADDVTIVYNDSTEDGHTGEVSRFVTQLMVESGHRVEKQSLQVGQTPLAWLPQQMEKKGDILLRLRELRDAKSIYPTTINRYLRCQLLFGFNDLMGIREPDPEEDIIDNRAFGNIFHRASQIVYERMRPAEAANNAPISIVRADIERALKDASVAERAVDQAIREELFDGTKEMPDLSGLQIINREVIVRYLRRLLEIDRDLAPFTILGTELTVQGSMDIATDEGRHTIRLRGIIDRLDMVVDKESGERRIRVIDYKTGSRALTRKVNAVEEIFAQPMQREKHPDYYLQTLTYAQMVSDDRQLNPQSLAVAPGLLFIQHATGTDYDPTLSIGKDAISDIRQLKDEFKPRLEAVLQEMFDTSVPLRPTSDREVCTTCPYRQLCGV